MDTINLKKYGKVISTEEYLIDKENFLIAEFNYIGETNTDTKYTEGQMSISSYFVIDDSVKKHEVEILQKSKSSEKVARLNFSTYKVLPLYGYKNLIESIFSNKTKDIELDAKKYTYESSNIKSETDFSIVVNCNNTDITLTFDSEYTVVVNGRTVIAKSKDNTSNQIVYIIGDMSYMKVEIKHPTLIDSISFVDFSCSGEPNVVDLDMYSTENSILSVIEQYSSLPCRLNNGVKNIKLEYDEFGLLKKSSLDNVLFEEVYIGEDELDYKASLHPLYFDYFNTELIYGNNYYCLEQLENISEKFYRFTKQIYKINDDKTEDVNSILKEKESDHPLIELVNILD